MKQFFKKVYNFQTLPEKHLEDLGSVIKKNKNVPFFIDALVNFLTLAFIFFVFILITPVAILVHYIQKIIVMFNFLYLTLKEKKQLAKQKKEIKIFVKQYEKYLTEDSKGYYYLKDFIFDKNSYNNIDSFIYHFITILNKDYETYYKKDVLICKTNKRRSLGDIFLICKTYYPACTIEDVLKILINFCEKDNNIVGSYCNQINKFVFHDQSNFYNTNSHTEYCYKYTFQDIINAYK